MNHSCGPGAKGSMRSSAASLRAGSTPMTRARSAKGICGGRVGALEVSAAASRGDRGTGVRACKLFSTSSRVTSRRRRACTRGQPADVSCMQARTGQHTLHTSMWARRTPFCLPTAHGRADINVPSRLRQASMPHLEHITRLLAAEVSVPLMPRKHILQERARLSASAALTCKRGRRVPA